MDEEGNVVEVDINGVGSWSGWSDGSEWGNGNGWNVGSTGNDAEDMVGSDDTW